MRWAMALALLGGAAIQGQDRVESDRPLVVQARVESAITPIAARFIERVIEQGEEERAACVVIVLDTSGGLLVSTRTIVKAILGSKVPVVVYVAPSGARAASAGVFITMAGHVAAMAPGTNIGAAHPVQAGGLPGSPPTPKEDKDRSGKQTVIEEKMLNDTVAWARALAELRGRNADWATRAVKESISVPASEAVRENAVDLVAQDMDDLLAQIDGREVKLATGMVRLNTGGARVKTLEMWWGERLLGAIVNPNIAFLLLMIGFWGIVLELYSPGWGVAGTLGAICLVLGFLAMAILPISYVGLALILVALGLFVAEVFVTSYGALTIGGIVCLVLGGIMLVDSPGGFTGVSLRIVIPVAVATAAITVFLVGSVVRAHRGRVRTGGEQLEGTEAIAQENFAFTGSHYAGAVQTHGELWRAESPTPVMAGQPVRVQQRRGLTLLVQAANEPSVLPRGNV